jgi:hypothetical protein
VAGPGATAEKLLVTIIGRGHSGTSILSRAFVESGIYFGSTLNKHGDTMPPRPMYKASRIVSRKVRWKGGMSWDFDRLHTMPIESDFERFVDTYLRDVLSSDRPLKGWKLPETTLAYPWIARMFPSAHYVHIVRYPRDGLLRDHPTDDLRKFDVPCPDTDDPLAQRLTSWKYQHEIVKATPQPERFISIRYEDLVLEHETTMQKLEKFLTIPLTRGVMDETRVGQWKNDRRLLPDLQPIDRDMRQLGYLGQS